MYGLPADFDAAFLVELTLIQVCIGENEVVLRFTDESHPSGIVTVIVTADLVVGHRSETVRHVDARTAGAGLLTFLGRPTTAAGGGTDGTLHLDFGDEFIEIFDTWEHYESYVIEVADQTVVV